MSNSCYFYPHTRKVIVYTEVGNIQLINRHSLPPFCLMTRHIIHQSTAKISIDLDTMMTLSSTRDDPTGVNQVHIPEYPTGKENPPQFSHLLQTWAGQVKVNKVIR